MNAGVEVAELSPGEHAVSLADVASNCSVTPPPPRAVVVASGMQATADLAVRRDSLLRNVIVFARTHDETSTIFWISPQGSAPVRIIEGGEPAISPDGRKIAFARVGAGIIGVWTANVDGTNPVLLTFSGEVNQSPRWSPDGQRLAFASNRDGNYEIYTMRADGSDQRRLTTDVAQDGSPVWSPDGARLAFTRTLEPQSNTEVFLLNPDGTGAVNLTAHPEGDNILDWAPDGDRLLINSTREWQLSNEIFTIDLNGMNAVNLTNHEAFDGDAKWSPDGEAIVFSSERIGHIHSVYRARADGQEVVRLTTPALGEADLSVTWVP
ncbi:MAG: TolB family protein [Gemmatimonadales bacterium]|nr:TolB family protein [Gemmatimonadales bacterium]